MKRVKHGFLMTYNLKIMLSGLLITGLLMYSCNNKKASQEDNTMEKGQTKYQELVSKYVSVSLTSDLSKLSDNQKEMIGLLIKASKIMDEIFWTEAYGAKDSLIAPLTDPEAIRYVQINYGPWDRLNDNKPFIDGIGEKPLGANFYPKDMTKEEFEKSSLTDKKSLYTMVRRDSTGALQTIPYHTFFESKVKEAASLLEKASELAEDPGFKKYLQLRSKALLTDDYFESDMAWMDMKDNMIDIVIGPIENYEDKMYNYKAAHEAYVLIKDMEWSEKLKKYAQFLPELQNGLPVADKYKQEKPGTDADLNAYDVIYYAGDCNSGSKTIAINLPNDEKVQLEKGSRRLQLKNAMRAKFDKIMMPIAEQLIDSTQRSHVVFDAFFANTMFHEVAHGLGIKKTINGKGTVRNALKEHFSAIEEGKADILGLYMVTQLHEKGELSGDLEDYYVTFLAGIFRSVRFGAASAHGKANMIRFNFFKEKGAFNRDASTGKYKVDFEKMKSAVQQLSEKILVLQGDGNYEEAGSLLDNMGVIGEQLQHDLEQLESSNIPVDIVFEQGVSVLGL